ncbi:MAG TPA: nuclear transport factor 2 family protein [Terriglobales bacterium]|nr:nuclear transport factor 2 family protein [Terriglobales bacterium]
MNDEEAISFAKTEFREAYNTGNVDRLLNVFADSFTDMSEGEASFYGKEAKAALRWRATNLFREYTATMEIVIIAVIVLGDSAYDWGWHKLTLIPKSGGEPIIKRFRYCEIWQKSPAGKWQIRIFINNKDHEPEMLPQQATAWAGSELAGASGVR